MILESGWESLSFSTQNIQTNTSYSHFHLNFQAQSLGWSQVVLRHQQVPQPQASVGCRAEEWPPVAGRLVANLLHSHLYTIWHIVSTKHLQKFNHIFNVVGINYLSFVNFLGCLPWYSVAKCRSKLQAPYRAASLCSTDWILLSPDWLATSWENFHKI